MDGARAATFQACNAEHSHFHDRSMPFKPRVRGPLSEHSLRADEVPTRELL